MGIAAPLAFNVPIIQGEDILRLCLSSNPIESIQYNMFKLMYI